MKVFLRIIGALLILAGIGVGVYVDLWFFLVGGIVQAVDGVKATPTNGHDVGWGLIRAIFGTGIGLFLTFFLLILPGLALLGISARDKLRRFWR